LIVITNNFTLYRNPSMFDSATINEAHKIAARLGVSTSALLAVAEIESAGKVFATINGKQEPLIRFEGHYFDRKLSGEDLASARSLGLASPKAGKVANPNSQAARWKLLERAAEINRQAAYESVSWGLGQVMGDHWKSLGFKSVFELVNLARKGAAGQMELMARFIEKNGLTDELRGKQWAAFAKRYNGSGYAKNAYDTKMAKADARWAKKLASGKAALPVVAGSDELSKKQVNSVMHRGSKGEFVKTLQKNLNHLGYGPLDEDGVFGEGTDIAVRSFQKDMGLRADGWAGPNTLEVIGKEIAKAKLKPRVEKAEAKTAEAEAKVDEAKVVVDQVANDGKVSVTEWLTGITGAGGALAAVKQVIESLTETTKSVGELVTSAGPWILLGVVVIGGAGYVIYTRRNQRLEAQAVKKVL
jgi:peptidoglycan hydrolase-like protein with peptidoglycan-binding domain